MKWWKLLQDPIFKIPNVHWKKGEMYEKHAHAYTKAIQEVWLSISKEN